MATKGSKPPFEPRRVTLEAKCHTSRLLDRLAHLARRQEIDVRRAFLTATIKEPEPGIKEQVL